MGKKQQLIEMINDNKLTDKQITFMIHFIKGIDTYNESNPID